MSKCEVICERKRQEIDKKEGGGTPPNTLQTIMPSLLLHPFLQSSHFLLFLREIQAWRELDEPVDKGEERGRQRGEQELEKKKNKAQGERD